MDSVTVSEHTTLVLGFVTDRDSCAFVFVFVTISVRIIGVGFCHCTMSARSVHSLP